MIRSAKCFADLSLSRKTGNLAPEADGSEYGLPWTLRKKGKVHESQPGNPLLLGGLRHPRIPDFRCLLVGPVSAIQDVRVLRPAGPACCGQTPGRVPWGRAGRLTNAARVVSLEHAVGLMARGHLQLGRGPGAQDSAVHSALQQRATPKPQFCKCSLA